MSLRNWFGFHPNNPQSELESTCEVLFHVFSWFSFFMPLITSMFLEFLLTWSSMFSSSSCIFFACSTNFYWRAVDSLVRSLMLFWFCLCCLCLPVYCFYSGAKLIKFSIHFFYYFFIFFALFSISLVRKIFRSSDICFMLILPAVMFNKSCYFCKI